MRLSMVLRVWLGLALSLAVLLGSGRQPATVQAGWHSLTGKQAQPAHFSSFDFSPDSNYVVYSFKQTDEPYYDLYSVPVTGTTATPLSPPLVDGGSVWQFQVTPDSQYVVYLADQEEAERVELYRVPVGGGQAVKLSGDLVDEGDVRFFEIDPGNTWVVYAADQDQDQMVELYSVPLAGGQSQKLNPALPSTADVESFFIEPNTGRVVYSADQEANGVYQLYSVPIGGGEWNRVGLPGMSVDDYAYAPGLAGVVFMGTPQGTTQANVYRSALNGAEPTRLNYPLAVNEHLLSFRVSADGAHVVFDVGVSSATVTEPLAGTLYSVPAGGVTVPLTFSASPGFGVNPSEYVLSPDSQRVVYYYQANESSQRVLESVALDSGGRARLYTPGGETISFDAYVSPNSQQVTFRTTPGYLAHTVPMAGGEVITHTPQAFVVGYTPDSTRLVYFGGYLTSDRNLHSQPVAGGEPANLSQLDEESYVSWAKLSPNGQGVLFRVDYHDGSTELRLSDGQPQETHRVYLPVLRRHAGAGS